MYKKYGYLNFTYDRNPVNLVNPVKFWVSTQPLYWLLSSYRRRLHSA